jgi:hypothetical protein
MDKKDWKESLEKMQKLLKEKKKQYAETTAFQEKDIVELEYCIKCYKQKI